MTIINLEHDDTAVQVTAEHGEIVIGHGHNPRISGSIRMTPDEAEELAKAINEAVDALGGRVAPEHWPYS